MQEPVAIIDIGSNSVRLVVYAGSQRVPAPIFNEKVLAGLGAGLAETGALSADSQEVALGALRRFHLLLEHMHVKQSRVVATAAARDARNGPQFIRAVERIGFRCDVLSAEQEARFAGEGILSAIPGADGIAGDLGGGSLELAELRDGAVRSAISLPLGVLRVRDNPKGEAQALETLRQALLQSGLRKHSRGRPFYMVGGSWRALARIHMIANNFPLPVKHEYSIPPADSALLRKMVASADSATRKAIAPARLATSPIAAMLLSQLIDELEPSELILSSFGIREGLLFSSLSKADQGLHPLIEAARDAGGGEHRFGQHGDILDGWIGAIFDDSPAMARLRHASCLLADVAWQASPDFRADRGVEMALHGNWVGVNAAGRVLMAQALSSNFGRDKLSEASLAQLCPPEQLEQARRWGYAMRLGQRLCGGVGSALKRTRLTRSGGTLRLEVRAGQEALVGEAVHRRLSRLAQALDLKPQVAIA